MKLASLQRQIEAHAPHLLLTCDTGTTEYEAIDYARSRLEAAFRQVEAYRRHFRTALLDRLLPV